MNPATIARGVWPDILPIILLVCSNLFMTLAWVWGPQKQIGCAGNRDSGELGHRLRGILLRRPGEPDRQRGLVAR